MTRNQSPQNVPTDANVEYYRKRAAGGVGLIVTEGTCVDHIAASGYPGVPYIHGKSDWQVGGALSTRFMLKGGK
jgi:2,4-dienoyl-CoA reductase-like NADH-dependent reductase (Old Yellow Enzyme family)